MVGDSLPDVAAARAARMRVVVLRSGYGAVVADDLEADEVLNSLDELPGWVGSSLVLGG
jgi:phosphoglycolate phosphatase-like HAD superfamily hydrolase